MKCVSGYKIYRRDRKRHGGGVAIYVHDDVTVMDVKVSDKLKPELEGIGVLLYHEGLYIPCFCLYRPPRFNRVELIYHNSILKIHF